MRRVRFIIFLGILLSGLVLAPMASRLVYGIIIEPLAYYWWVIKQVGKAIPQSIYWIFVVSSLGIIVLVIQLRTYLKTNPQKVSGSRQQHPIEQLARQIKHASNSSYFKWVISNHIANLNEEISHQHQGSTIEREQRPSDAKGKPLVKVEKYLSAGLHNSFLDFRSKGRLFKRHNKSPLDIDLEEVIYYLENRMELE